MGKYATCQASSSLLHVAKRLADRILMAAAEGRVDQFTGIGMARMRADLGAGFHRAHDAAHVGEIEQRVDALRIEIHGHGDEIHVAGALAIAEQGALDTVGAGHHCQFGGRHAAAAIIVRVHADAQLVAEMVM
jgi:hypothetical protein